MTYNIRGGLGLDRRRDMGRIADVVAAEAPDVVCFQEIHQRLRVSGWVDQPKRLAKALGLTFVFQANLRLGFGYYGLGVATRFALRRVLRHRLPSAGERRGALQVEVETPDGPITVFCTHWGLTRSERSEQARVLTGHLCSVTTPMIFCGDLNDTPASDYVRAMLTQANLCDTGAATGLPTYPADRPSVRIDVLCVSPEFRTDRLCVIPSYASDHRPLVANIVLAP